MCLADDNTLATYRPSAGLGKNGVSSRALVHTFVDSHLLHAHGEYVETYVILRRD